jgi:hypothetical protein
MIKAASKIKCDVWYEPTFCHCKDFLCPPETKIQEWFPTELQARLRAKVLDPFGLMLEKNQGVGNEGGKIIAYCCKDENCHAKIFMRKVVPDPEGNAYGVYGCISHQHSLTRQNKSEIVFKNKAEVDDFFEKNLRSTYTVQTTGNKKKSANYRTFECRRKNLKNDGNVDCKSWFSYRESMPRVEDTLPKDERPHCLYGIFYHCHENDIKYHKDELGGWKSCKKSKSAKRKLYYARVINNQVFPIRARKKYTVQDVLEAKKKGHSLIVTD